MGPPQLGQRPRELDSWGVDVSVSIWDGTALSIAKHSGRSLALWRLARKPKLRMRTKLLGSRCRRKRRRNSSSDKLTNFCSLLWAESRQRKVTWLSAKATNRWLEMATRWV